MTWTIWMSWYGYTGYTHISSFYYTIPMSIQSGKRRKEGNTPKRNTKMDQTIYILVSYWQWAYCMYNWALEIWKKFEIGSRHFCWNHLYLRKCNRIHHIRHISKQIMANLSWISKSFLSLYLTFLYFHCMSAHQHLRHFCEYLWRLELEFWIEKTVSQRDSSIHPLSNPLCPPRSETVFVILA